MKQRVQLEKDSNLSVADIAAMKQSKLHTTTYTDRGTKAKLIDFFKLNQTQATFLFLIFLFFLIVALITAVVVYIITKLLELQRRQEDKMIEMQNRAMMELFEKSQKGTLSPEDLPKSLNLLQGKSKGKDDIEAGTGNYGQLIEDPESSRGANTIDTGRQQ